MRICAALLWAAVLAAPVAGAEKPMPVLSVAFTRKVLETFSPEEVIAVTQPFADLLGRRLGCKVVIKHFGTVEGAALEARQGKQQFIFSDALDFVRLEARHKGGEHRVLPVAVGCVAGGEERYAATKVCIVAREDSGLPSLDGPRGTKLDSLRGTRLVVAEKGETCSYLRLETLLAKCGILRREGFFAQIIECEDQDTALEKVLNRRADVACVSQDYYLLKREDERSADRGRLIAIWESPEEYPAPGAFYYKGMVDEELVHKVRHHIEDMRNCPEGDQILVFFNMTGFKAVGLDAYDEVRRLVAEVAALRHRVKVKEKKK